MEGKSNIIGLSISSTNKGVRQVNNIVKKYFKKMTPFQFNSHVKD